MAITVYDIVQGGQWQSEHGEATRQSNRRSQASNLLGRADHANMRRPIVRDLQELLQQ